MKLSTHTYPFLDLGYRNAVKAIHDGGFDAYDFSMFQMATEDSLLTRDGWRETILDLRKYADSLGITCNQSHAPFPMWRKDDENWNKNIQGWIIRALEITSLLGGKVCVVHPANDWSPKDNAERVYLPLLPYCKKFGVQIGVENMWNWKDGAADPCACSLADNYTEHLSLLDPDWFVACLDIGHAEMFGELTSAKELIHTLGNRLKALHVHDNDRHRDLHSFPYTGTIAWKDVLEALHDIKYDGDVTFEVDAMARMPEEIKNEGMRYLKIVGRYMIKEIQKA